VERWKVKNRYIIMGNMTLEEAKKLFFSFNCSRFTMGREEPQKYQLYIGLNVDKALENEWREELLALYYRNVENDQSCIKFNQMYDLFENINSKSGLSIMIKALEQVLKILEEQNKIIIAETIIGRKAHSCRSGLIYMAYDLGELEKASLFAQYALQLLAGAFEDVKLQKRLENVKKECVEIMKELSLILL